MKILLFLVEVLQGHVLFGTINLSKLRRGKAGFSFFLTMNTTSNVKFNTLRLTFLLKSLNHGMNKNPEKIMFCPEFDREKCICQISAAFELQSSAFAADEL
jgi:hypothetical protein